MGTTPIQYYHRTRTINGKKFKLVFQGMVKDFSVPEIKRLVKFWHEQGNKTRVIKIHTKRGIEWTIWAYPAKQRLQSGRMRYKR